MGREQFARDHDVSLDGEMTVAEFIALTENAYGGEAIKRLKEALRRQCRWDTVCSIG